jgi:hypothetical protein
MRVGLFAVVSTTDLDIKPRISALDAYIICCKQALSPSVGERERESSRCSSSRDSNLICLGHTSHTSHSWYSCTIKFEFTYCTVWVH